MPPPKLNLSLYLVTDSALLPAGRTLASHVRASIAGGATIVQLREKTLPTAQLIELGKQIHKVTSSLDVPLLINDRVDVAMAVGCEGVHLGWDDMDCETARHIMGPNAIIGLSVSNRNQLSLALKANPSYLGLGPVFQTATKPDHNTPLGISGIRSLLAHTPAHMPTVAIGGINSHNLQRVSLLSRSDEPKKCLNGVAIVSAIMTSPSPERTCQELTDLLLQSPSWFDTSQQTPSFEDYPSHLLSLLQRTREHPPLIHHITNNVSKTLSANITLAIGASPIMSENPAEFTDLALLNDAHVALVLNMGTFTASAQTIFHDALVAHNARRNPVVFDPVGCGASSARRQFAAFVLDAGYCDVVKGNEGEILTIAGENICMRGVDGAGSTSGETRVIELAGICAGLARRDGIPTYSVLKTVLTAIGNIIVMTGPTDIVSNGRRTYLLRNGDPIQTRVTGIGCVLASVIAATLAGATSHSERIDAVVAAVAAFNVAAEQAVAMAAGPASWAVAFVDVLAAELVGFEKSVKIEEVQV